ncbi:aminomethyltransferase [Arboricoccus pini]|uniref:aminomethyltransferase n=1 Tax=Arboricoccus pini TaxID=1963835 RepID=A0A212S1W4_9PROT|nr:glycine cleavage system aminomethyltransferase GcvT [Arboricoccus pini]SNB79135.1 aminomethyltransferase [Arboricoccus pini]
MDARRLARGEEMIVSEQESATARRTPLFELHRELGAKFVTFAGYEMPIQYQAGIMAEHLQCRSGAALFDVSHMVQIKVAGPDAALGLERLVPGNIKDLAPNRARYTLLTNDAGGILDDLIVTNAEDHLYIVANAATGAADLAHIKAELGTTCEVEALADRALLALQGPLAAQVLARLNPRVMQLRFMEGCDLKLGMIEARVSRLGYTGEDGFEISLAAEQATDLARLLLAAPEVEAAGLGARDSLRLEAGLCLYGNDIDATRTPIEADLAWTIGKRRREEGGFAGHEVILRQLREGTERKLVGVRPTGRAPARAGTEIQSVTGAPIGKVTSGGYGPSVGAPVALGYVVTNAAEIGTEIQLDVRGRSLPAEIVALPFVPHRYHR